MKDTIRSATQFAERFNEIRPHQFSQTALHAIFDWYEELEEDTGEEVEFDPIAICCDWSEMDEEDIRREYDRVDGIEDADSLDELYDALIEHTMVIDTDNDTLVVLAF